MTTRNLSLALALALSATAAGCATSPGVGNPGGDDQGSNMGSDDGGSDDGGSDDAPTPLELDGKYSVASTYDLTTNMPGTVGTVVNDIIAATDDSDDPAHWIIDQALAAMPSGTIKSFLQDAEPYVTGYINDALLDVAPDFVTTFVQMSKDLGDVAKKFGTVDEIDIANGVATHIITGAHFKVGTTEADYLFANYGMQNVSVGNIAVTIDATQKVTIAEHKMPLAYGAVLRIALDAAIIPALDANAHNLTDLLSDLVDCNGIGTIIDNYIGFGGAGTYASACKAGMTYAANYLYAQLAKVDGTALDFDISGVAKASDANGDGVADGLKVGAWSGMLDYGTVPSTLAPATFSGTRM
jgi:hypothetical protein